MALTKVTYSMIKGAAINVLDYGADPTGTNDSTAAIQAAIDYVGTLTQNRPTIFIPAGTYIVTAPIEIQLSGLIIQGAGQSCPYNSQTSSQYAGGTFIKYTGSALNDTTDGVFKLGSLVGAGDMARNVILQDFSIVCSDLANAIWAARCNSCSFIRLTTDQAIWGARFYDSNNNSNLFDNCEFYDPTTGGGGLDLRTSCHSVTVNECRFNNKTTGTRNPYAAIDVAADVNGSDITIQNCNFDFYRVTSTHVRVSNDCKGFNFTGNYIEARGDGITPNVLILAGGSGINISGNRFSKSNTPTATTVDYGVNCYATCESVSITGNYFSGFDTAAVRVASGCTGVFYAGNYETGTPTSVNDQNSPENAVVFANNDPVGTIFSGTYTPTATIVTNIDAITPVSCQYMRVGNVITVSGQINIDPTTTAGTAFELSLPIASNLSGGNTASGICANGFGDVLRMYGNSTNNTINCTGPVTDASARDYDFTFTYRIV